MIHGRASSIGCLAVGDEAAEGLFVLAAETGLANISVVLSPVDFRKRELPSTAAPLPARTEALYGKIRSRLSQLVASHP